MDEGEERDARFVSMERLTKREAAALRHFAQLTRHPRARPDMKHLFSLWDLHDRLTKDDAAEGDVPKRAL